MSQSASLVYRFEDSPAPLITLSIDLHAASVPPLPNIGDTVIFNLTNVKKVEARVMDRRYTYEIPSENIKLLHETREVGIEGNAFTYIIEIILAR